MFLLFFRFFCLLLAGQVTLELLNGRCHAKNGGERLMPQRAARAALYAVLFILCAAVLGEIASWLLYREHMIEGEEGRFFIREIVSMLVAFSIAVFAGRTKIFRGDK